MHVQLWSLMWTTLDQSKPKINTQQFRTHWIALAIKEEKQRSDDKDNDDDNNEVHHEPTHETPKDTKQRQPISD